MEYQNVHRFYIIVPREMLRFFVYKLKRCKTILRNVFARYTRGDWNQRCFYGVQLSAKENKRFRNGGEGKTNALHAFDNVHCRELSAYETTEKESAHLSNPFVLCARNIYLSLCALCLSRRKAYEKGFVVKKKRERKKKKKHKTLSNKVARNTQLLQIRRPSRFYADVLIFCCIR